MNKNTFLKALRTPKLFYKLFFFLFLFFMLLIFLLWIFLYLDVILGKYYYKKNSFDKSALHYEKALKKYLNKRHHNKKIENILNYNLANALYKNKKNDEANKIYKDILNKLRDDELDIKAKTLFNLGDSSLVMSDISEAKEFFKKALELNPMDNEARFNFEFAKLLESNNPESSDKNKKEQEKNTGDKNKNSSKSSSESDKDENNEKSSDQNKEEKENKDSANSGLENKEREEQEKNKDLSKSSSENNKNENNEKSNNKELIEVDDNKEEKINNASRLIDILSKENQKKQEKNKKNNKFVSNFKIDKDW